MPGPPQRPDWTDASAYAALLGAERAVFAWEWLRRDCAYQRQAAASGGFGHHMKSEEAAGAFGLIRFEDARLACPAARPVWRAADHPWVVAGRAEPARGPSDAFDLDALAAIATLVEGSGCRHLLLSDGRRSLRLDCTGLPLRGTPVELAYRIHGIGSLERSLRVLERLRFLATRGRFSIRLHPPANGRRLILALRASDGIAAGATQADLAFTLLAPRLDRLGWRAALPSLRSRAQRLSRLARHLAADGWRQLLL